MEIPGGMMLEETLCVEPVIVIGRLVKHGEVAAGQTVNFHFVPAGPIDVFDGSDCVKAPPLLRDPE
jgi:hypothetical protein